MKCSKSPGRRGFAPDPTGGAYSTSPNPLAGGEINIPSLRTPPLLAFQASLFSPRSSCGSTVVDRLAPMNLEQK